jgi:hypothetical protein
MFQHRRHVDHALMHRKAAGHFPCETQWRVTHAAASVAKEVRPMRDTVQDMASPYRKAFARWMVGCGLATCLGASAVMAQGALDSPPGLLPGSNREMLVDPTTFTIDGGWEYTSEWGAGLMDISQGGDGIVLEIVSGSTCDPVEMCTLSGNIEDMALVVFVSASVPAGGSASSTFVIYFESETEASGLGTSVWSGEGHEMRWDYTISMWRPGTREETEIETLGD